MKQEKTRQLALSALMIALVFVCTYTIKIPNPATGGYSHMGDCMIFLSILILGKKQGALAGGLGGALSDLLSGAAMWVIPTFIIKLIMGWIMGYFIEMKVNEKYGWLIGAALGGIWQSIAYTVVKIAMVGIAPAIASIPNLLIQTMVGFIIYVFIAKALSHSKIVNLKGVVIS